jgi:hypothetical protein
MLVPGFLHSLVLHHMFDAHLSAAWNTAHGRPLSRDLPARPPLTANLWRAALALRVERVILGAMPTLISRVPPFSESVD